MSEKTKTCFVIMSISDVDGYDTGHFTRIYENIIKPSVEKAGFSPIRADDEKKTNDIRIDILKKIIKSDMAICDLSTKNPNVLYELGIRQAFNMPVSLIKDKRTMRIFDIAGFRDYEYCESLRYDLVEIAVKEISEIIKKTYEGKKENINSLTKLLKIEPADITEDNFKLSKESTLILNELMDLKNRVENFKHPFYIDPTNNKFLYPKKFDISNPTNKDWTVIIKDKWSELFEKNKTISNQVNKKEENTLHDE